MAWRIEGNTIVEVGPNSELNLSGADKVIDATEAIEQNFLVF